MFQAKCVRCHGDKATRGDLDLTTPEGVLKGGLSGPVIVPGKPDHSLLFDKIHGGKMPPPASKETLSDAEVDVVRRWIAAGPGSAPARARPPTQDDVVPILLHGLPRHAPAGGGP